MKNNQPLKINLSDEHAGARLDKVLAEITEIKTRNRAQHLIDAKLVHINGQLAKSSHKCKAGDQIEVQLPQAVETTLQPMEMNLDILFEDQDLIVINKPAHLVVHPGAGHQQDTLVNALISHTPNLSMKFNENRPGIVHRLDKDTSGVLVVAKNDFAHEHLAQQFKQRTIHRIYWALVHGSPRTPSGKISSHLARHPTHRKKFSSNKNEQGKLAVTHFQTLEKLNSVTWLQLKLETGRTHQIRVHLSEEGCPILGDSLYGADRRIKNLNSAATNHVKNMNRFALHACELGFEHPTTKENLFFKVEWPDELSQLLELLK